MLAGVKSKFVIVALGIVLLLLNPAGFCAGNVSSSSGGHPCCPKAPVAKSSCLCIDRQSTAPAVVVSFDSVPLVEDYFVLEPANTELPAFAPETPPLDRAIIFRQILI